MEFFWARGAGRFEDIATRLVELDESMSKAPETIGVGEAIVS
jgi:hypothetical protein